MKHSPIALGFAALSAMSLIVACDVDPNRVDKDVEGTKIKNLCARSPLMLDLEKLNLDRENKLAGNDQVEVRNIHLAKGHTPVVRSAKLKTSSADKKAMIQLEKTCEAGTVDLIMPEYFGMNFQSSKIKKINNNGLELTHELADIVIEVQGLSSGNTKDVASEDGFNQIKVTVNFKDSQDLDESSRNTTEIVINETALANEDIFLTQAEHDFIKTSSEGFQSASVTGVKTDIGQYRIPLSKVQIVKGENPRVTVEEL